MCLRQRDAEILHLRELHALAEFELAEERRKVAHMDALAFFMAMTIMTIGLVVFFA